MQVHLIAAGTRMPRWVTEAYDDYARRLPHACRLSLREIPLGQRRGEDARRAVAEEGERMLAALPCLVVGYEADWSAFADGPGKRAEMSIGRIGVDRIAS